MTGPKAAFIPPWRQRIANSAPKVPDLSAPREAVNAAANRARGLWLGYIALLAYLFITVGAVTYRDLLLQSPVKLPVLNIDLPLVGFFAVAGVFFLINHFYLLLNLLGLSRRIEEFNSALEASGLPQEPEKTERRRLDTFVIVQMLGGTAEERGGETGRFLKLISVITLVIAPVLLLLFIQLKFLPYQDELVTWLHRITLLVDLWLLWIFWPAIQNGDWDRSARPYLARVTVLLIFVFSCFLATFPGEYADGGLKARYWKTHRDSELWWVKGPIFGTIAPATNDFDSEGRILTGLLFFARALDLSDDQTLIDQDAFEKIRNRFNQDHSNQIPWGEARVPSESQRTLSFRERNLRGAVFDRSDLRNVDFENASLQGASLDGTRLQGASLEFASLQGASLNSASLQGASLSYSNARSASLELANLKGAALDGTSLKGASMERASLQDAWLRLANLQGASLDGANLKGISLDRTNLQDASLRGSSLIDASLIGANLMSAALHEANLQDAALDGANLKGAALDYANLQGASLEGARLQRALLHEANLKGAALDGANLKGAALRGAYLQGAALDATSLQGASLVAASLQGASLHEANLMGATLDAASLQGAALYGANLRGASLQFANLQGASLEFADLRGALLDHARLQGASLDGTWLRGASFKDAFFWRAYGQPLFVEAGKVNVVRPAFSALSPEAIDRLEEKAFEGIEDIAVLVRIRERLRRLRATESEQKQGILETFWTNIDLKKDTLVYSRTLKEVLWSTACTIEINEDVPHTAEGLIRSMSFRSARLDALGPVHLPNLARDLLDAAENPTDECPGVRGLDEGSLARLREWARGAND